MCQVGRGSRLRRHSSGTRSSPTCDATIPPTIAQIVSRSPPAPAASHRASGKLSRCSAQHQSAKGTVSWADMAVPFPRMDTANWIDLGRAHGEWASAQRSRAPQGQCSGKGGASVPSAQAAVRLHEGPVPRLEEEHRADRHVVRVEQPLDGSASTDGGVGMSASGSGRGADFGRFDRPAEARRGPVSSANAARVSPDDSTFQTCRQY
jgi:hypothetical protein